MNGIPAGPSIVAADESSRTTVRTSCPRAFSRVDTGSRPARCPRLRPYSQASRMRLTPAAPVADVHDAVGLPYVIPPPQPNILPVFFQEHATPKPISDSPDISLRWPGHASGSRP